MTEDSVAGAGRADPQTAEETPSRFKKVTRKRVTISIHPESDRRLVQMCLDYKLPRGVILDRCITALSNASISGVRHCADGPRCVHNLRFDSKVM